MGRTGESESGRRRRYGRAVRAAVVFANLLPLAGVVTLEWGLSDLLLVYWIEAGAAVLAGFVKIAPARLVTLPLPDPRRRPQLGTRRGRIRLPGGITLRVRNAWRLVTQALLLGLWAVAGTAFFLPRSPLSSSPEAAAGGVAVVGGALAATRVLTTRRYFADERYDRVSAKRAGYASAVYALCLFALVALLSTRFAGVLESDASSSLALALVVAKVGADLLVRRRGGVGRLDADADPFDYRPSVRSVLTRRTSGAAVAALPAVDRPAGPPRATARPSRSSIIRASPVLGTTGNAGMMALLLVAFALVAVWGRSPPAVPLVALAAALALLWIPTALREIPRHGPLQYELHDDELVCYDRWLDVPVWRLPYDDVESVGVERGIAARVGGYGTVVVGTTDDRPARMAYLRDARAVADRIERVVDGRATSPPSATTD